MQVFQNQPVNPSSVPTPAQPSPNQPSPPAAAPQAPPATAPSVLDHPAQPAKVSLTSGKLTVEADNSSLSEILHQVSHAGGMKIEGLQASGSDQRIFGSYGPGAPRDVLSELLDGSGYNVMMLGQTPAGVPRELALTKRTTGGPSPQPQASNDAQDDDNDDFVQPTQYQDERPNIAPQPGPPEMRNGVRSPQQILQELQRMREEQQQQPQQQQDQQPN